MLIDCPKLLNSPTARYHLTNSQSILSMMTRMASYVRGLVPRSASLCSPLTFLTAIFPDLVACCSHKSCTSMCRSLPNPMRPITPIAALESTPPLTKRKPENE